ncbi:MAG: polyketide synthase dehydratase domain-containing protein, partial [Nocardiopsaceae bacterium]|nr:polyketide synthase dehydratase domain-containing protein [Nocardiopsaceae bacterium]
HSIGELAAAQVAGVLSLPAACALVAARARLMQRLPGGGAMAAIEAAEEEITRSLSAPEGTVAIAAVNGPSATVISGDEDAVARVVAHWAGQGRKTRPLRVWNAFHSPRMDPMLEEFRTAAANIYGANMSGRPAAIPVVSGLTGELADERMADPGYWVRQVREPVRFGPGLRWLHDHQVRWFAETGPGGSLLSLAGAAAEGDGEPAGDPPGDRLLLPMLRPGRPEPESSVMALAKIFACGGRVDWPRVPGLGGGRRSDLPVYAFQRRRYWPAGGPGKNAAGLGVTGADHPLLGAVVELPGQEGWVITGELSLAAQPWLADHSIQGTVLMPATGLAEMAGRAGAVAGCPVVEELTLQAPLVLPARGAVAVQVRVGAADGDGRRPIEVHARLAGQAGEWVRHASGALAVPSARAAGRPVRSAAWPPVGADQVDITEWYERLRDLGYDYGPAFRGLRAAWRLGQDVFVEVSPPEAENLHPAGYGVHPALLDAVLQAALLRDGVAGKGPVVPFSWAGLTIYSRNTVHTSDAGVLRARLGPAGPDAESRDAAAMSVECFDPDGVPVVSARSVVLRPVPAGQLGSARARTGRSLWETDWIPAPSGDGQREEAASAGTGPAWITAIAGDEVDPAALTGRILGVLQDWLEAGPAGPPLVIVTRGAVAAGPGEAVTDLPGAAVWGLV